ncbi:MAG: hypothetical protein WCJ35_12880 [Planctomycetota bacterium]
MTKPKLTNSVNPGRATRAPLRAAVSLQVAIVLIVLLATAAVAVGIVLVTRGQEYAHCETFGCWWFTAIMTLLAVNVLAASVAWFSWKKRLLAGVILHAGLLLLLVGCVQYALHGIDGQISLAADETIDRVDCQKRSRLQVAWDPKSDQSNRSPAGFVFQPGESYWSQGNELDLGESGGVRLRVLRYFSHAAKKEGWVADETGDKIAALSLILARVKGKPAAELWMLADRSGSQADVGSIKIDFQRAVADSMAEDFLHSSQVHSDILYPAVYPEPRVEFLAFPSGKLLCRVSHQGKYRLQREVRRGDVIETPGEIKITMGDYLPKARPEVSYEPLFSPSKTGDDAAAEIEMTLDGQTQRFWLERGKPAREFPSPRGTTTTAKVSFRRDDAALGFSLRLQEHPPEEAGSDVSKASLTSSVQVIDPVRGIDVVHEISREKPLIHGGFTLAPFTILPDGKGMIFTVAHDPGSFIKCLGAALAGVGLLVWLIPSRKRREQNTK